MCVALGMARGDHQHTEKTTRGTHVIDATPHEPVSSAARKPGYAKCSKTSPPCCTHKTKRRRQLLRSLSIPTSALSSWRQLTFESRPEERIQQVQVWRSGRLEDDVPSRAWHVFVVPLLGWGTCVRGSVVQNAQIFSIALH